MLQAKDAPHVIGVSDDAMARKRRNKLHPRSASRRSSQESRAAERRYGVRGATAAMNRHEPM